MPKILSPERVIEYSVEYKVRVVKLTYELEVKAIDIAHVLHLHPMMIYRWRQEFREGKLVDQPSRRISMTKKPASVREDRLKDDEITRLKKELSATKKENAFLKKWERYLKEEKKRDSSL